MDPVFSLRLAFTNLINKQKSPNEKKYQHRPQIARTKTSQRTLTPELEVREPLYG